ncbi:MAG: glycosyltransferase family 39 protein [Actinobacteria bacterium]|nr:MAG: glycosyltransferase family 39 protein [Actinomycetota bacterium]
MTAATAATAATDTLRTAAPAAAPAPAPPGDDIRPRWGRRLQRAPGVVLGSVALLPVGAYLWVALHRLGYPFELEWLEGGAVGIVQRAAAGHGLYVQPSLHYVPWPYPPMYFWTSAAVAHVTGVGFLALRLVSFTASLATFVVIYILVRSGTSDRVAGVCAVGLYAATFRLSGAWLDLGRVDSLFLLLFLLAVLVARRARSWRGGIAVGALVFLAFFTKQTALVAALPLLGWLLLRRPRVGAAAAGATGVLVIGSTPVMNALSHGWYGYYVFDELSHQPFVAGAVAGFWTHDLWQPLGVALLLGVAGVLARLATKVSPLHGRGMLGFDLAVVLGLVVAGWVGRLHSGGWDDVLIPAAAGAALLVGHAVAALRRASPFRWRWLVTAVLAVPLVVQLDQLRYPLAAQIPTAADHRAGNQLVASLRHLPGQVIVLDHPWYATLAGKGTSAQEEAIYEVLRSGDDRGRRVLLRDLPGAVASPAVGAVVLDNGDEARGFAAVLARDFIEVPVPLVPGDALYPVTDQRVRPTLLFVRRTAPR